MRVVGIDPGIDGGLAFIDSRSKALPDVEVMPVYEDDEGRNLLVVQVSDWIMAREPDLVLIERSWGVAAWGATKCFKFGGVFWQLRAIAELLGHKPKFVAPKTWKKRMLPDASRDKSIAIGWCLREYPRLDLMRTPKCRKPHDGMADALVIAAYGIAEGHCLLST